MAPTPRRGHARHRQGAGDVQVGDAVDVHARPVRRSATASTVAPNRSALPLASVSTLGGLARQGELGRAGNRHRPGGQHVGHAGGAVGDGAVAADRARTRSCGLTGRWAGRRVGRSAPGLSRSRVPSALKSKARVQFSPAQNRSPRCSGPARDPRAPVNEASRRADAHLHAFTPAHLQRRAVVAPTRRGHARTARAETSRSAMPSTYTRAPVRRSATVSTVAPSRSAPLLASVSTSASGARAELGPCRQSPPARWSAR